MVAKNFYIILCRKQFPLILAYAVTIHKCQGLSLDSAIIDLSAKVFTSGMALSRVRILSDLYLIAFDPDCISVITKCIQEVNRLRQMYTERTYHFMQCLL